jgi:hypothetical protein
MRQQRYKVNHNPEDAAKEKAKYKTWKKGPYGKVSCMLSRLWQFPFSLINTKQLHAP